MRRLATRISKRKGVQFYSYPAFAFAGRPNVGGVSRGSEGASPTDLGERSPGGPQGPERIQSCYAKFGLFKLF
jgi:hypothetical protein